MEYPSDIQAWPISAIFMLIEMKIIIVGAGISGLATYLFLKKYFPLANEVRVYEKHQTLRYEHSQATSSGRGAVLGVSANGLRVLRDLGPKLTDRVLREGSICKYFQFQNANGVPLGRIRTGRRDDEFCICISRDALWKALMAEAGDVVTYREVTTIKHNPETGKAIVKLGEFGEDEADLVIGADGINSVVRRHLLGTENFCPRYSGQAWAGGCIDLESFPGRDEREDAMVFTIGKGDLFCYSTGSQRMSWLSIFPRRQPFHSSSKTQLARQTNWKDPLIGKMIAEAEPSHVYGIKTLPKLPMWGANRIVLVGDSAHAMSPITGQGASQSLEDAQTLALLLRNMIRKFPADEVNSNSLSTTIERTLSTYYDIRHRRVERIAAVGSALDKRMLKTQPLADYIRYTLFRAINSFPIITRKLVDSLNERLYGWDAKEGIESAMSKCWTYKEPYKQQRFDPGTIETRISPESMAIINGEFLRLKGFNEVKLNSDVRDFLEDVHSSFKSKCALNPRGPKFKKSLIHYAAMGDCSELLRFLLANGAPKDDRDQNSRTPLSWAAEYGALKSVKILLEDGAEINSKDDMFSTPLSWLVHAGVPTPQLAATEAYLRQKGAKEKGAKRGWILRKIRML